MERAPSFEDVATGKVTCASVNDQMPMCTQVAPIGWGRLLTKGKEKEESKPRREGVKEGGKLFCTDLNGINVWDVQRIKQYLIPPTPPKDFSPKLCISRESEHGPGILLNCNCKSFAVGLSF